MTTLTVSRSATGQLKWFSEEVRNAKILKQLQLEGYTVKVDTELLGSKYYIARSASFVSNHVEKVITSSTQLKAYLKEWNRYSHLHDSIEVIARDEVAQRAADRILGN